MRQQFLIGLVKKQIDIEWRETGCKAEEINKSKMQLRTKIMYRSDI